MKNAMNKQRGANAGQSEAATIRRAEAVTMRLHGTGYRTIAASLGVSVSTAHGYVDKEMTALNNATREEAESLRLLESMRLDDALQRVYEIVNDDHAEPDLVLRAVDRLIRIGESRRKLLGLDLPPQEATGDEPLTINLPDSLIEALKSRDEAAASAPPRLAVA